MTEEMQKYTVNVTVTDEYFPNSWISRKIGQFGYTLYMYTLVTGDEVQGWEGSLPRA